MNRKERPYLCFSSKKVAAAYLFWTETRCTFLITWLVHIHACERDFLATDFRLERPGGAVILNVLTYTYSTPYSQLLWPRKHTSSAPAFLRLFWEITRILYTAYIFWTGSWRADLYPCDTVHIFFNDLPADCRVHLTGLGCIRLSVPILGFPFLS